VSAWPNSDRCEFDEGEIVAVTPPAEKQHFRRLRFGAGSPECAPKRTSAEAYEFIGAR